jgi:hypothetical protein
MLAESFVKMVESQKSAFAGGKRGGGRTRRRRMWALSTSTVEDTNGSTMWCLEPEAGSLARL